MAGGHHGQGPGVVQEAARSARGWYPEVGSKARGQLPLPTTPTRGALRVPDRLSDPGLADSAAPTVKQGEPTALSKPLI